MMTDDERKRLIEKAVSHLVEAASYMEEAMSHIEVDAWQLLTAASVVASKGIPNKTDAWVVEQYGKFMRNAYEDEALNMSNPRRRDSI